MRTLNLKIPMLIDATNRHSTADLLYFLLMVNRGRITYRL